MKKLLFTYRNWRGVEHTYLVTPTSIKYGMMRTKEDDSSEEEMHWMLNAQCIDRSGKPHPFPRSFILQNMRDVEEVTVDGNPLG